MNKRTLVLGIALAAVVAVPAVAQAVSSSAGDQEASSGPAGESFEGRYGWMNDMHDYMWGDSDGTLPDGLSPDEASWMMDMHDSMWGDGTSSDDVSWMNDIHDSMWGDQDEPAVESDTSPGTPTPGPGGFGMGSVGSGMMGNG